MSYTASAQVTVTPNNLQGWSRSDTRPGGGVRFLFDGSTPSGVGALRMTTDNTTAAKAQFLHTAPNTLLTTVTQLSYYTKQVSAPLFPDAAPSYQVAVWLDGTVGASTFTNLVYEPYNNGFSITPNAWQQWDVDAGRFWSSRTVTTGGCSVTNGAGGPPFYTLAQLAINCPNAVVVGFGVNIGSFNPSYNVETDLINFNGTTYNFEPQTAVSISPAATPTATDNDYTRINNAVQLVSDGSTITLSGTFNWTEPNAAASWALGSDGQTGGVFSADDYEIVVPSNLNGVTFTAASLGAATIQGPGDLAAVNLEGVLDFEGGPNQNWTISNIRFLDFDLSIGMFNGAGGVTAYNNTQIVNNYILVAKDLNATVAPLDVNQNIGIHYSFGTNQTISGNTIEVHGDGVSDTAASKFSTEVGMQSNTSGGAVYDGLQITNNVIRVLNAQNNANPQIVLGIWENAHGHSSNITVSGNQFLNPAVGNNPAVNLQRGFRVTSHSSATTAVTYSNNSVTGANIGFQWLSTSGATQPVNLTSNLILNNRTGVKLDANGSANLSFNRIVGNSVAGVDNTLGLSVTAENNWWGCNYGPGAGGAGCVGTANGVLGTVDANPWLVLRTVTSPSPILTGGTSNVSSNLNFNSDNLNTSGSGTVPNGTPSAFTATLGTVSPTSGATVGGTTGTTFTAGGSAGNGSANTTIDGQTVNAPIVIDSTSCNTVSAPSGMTALRNTTLTVPVTTDSLTGRGVGSYDFTFTYNSATLTYASFDQSSTLSSGMTITVNSSTPGSLVISGFSGTDLTGSGTLLKLNFTVNGGIGTTSPLSFGSFKYNEGTPCANTTAGSFSVISGTVTGTVSYLNSVAFRPVANTTLNAVGAVNFSTNSIANGTYSLSGFGNSAYTVTPSKSGDINGAVTSFDAARIAQHVVGIINPGITPFNPGGGAEQSADVSGNGTITSFDAAMIARYVVLLPNTGSAGTWRFVPVSRSLTLVEVQTGKSGENYSAILMGDVSGNWNGPENPTFTNPQNEVKSEDLINISAPRISAEAGSDFIIPVALSNLNRKDIISYQFDLAYSPDVIEPQTNPCSIVETISKDLTVTCNAETPGLLKVAVFGVAPLKGEGVLLNLKFTATGAADSVTALEINSQMFNEGEPLSKANNGEVRISSQPSNNVSIRGQLMTATGQSVANTAVVITNTTGQTRTVRSNSFGNYSFDGVTIGETYVITVNSKRYTFTPQTVSAVDGITTLNMIAEQ